MTVNDTALTNHTVSRVESPDPIDSLDLTVCPADDILDGCKVSIGKLLVFSYYHEVHGLLQKAFNVRICFVALPVWPAHKEAGEAASPSKCHRRTPL